MTSQGHTDHFVGIFQRYHAIVLSAIQYHVHLHALIYLPACLHPIAGDTKEGLAKNLHHVLATTISDHYISRAGL